MIRFTFTKKVRLLKSACFTLVFKQSQIIKTSYIIMLNCFNLLGYSRIGLIISKKYIKKSHERNLIKRLIRESFRIHQHMLYSMDFIVIFKKKEFIFNNNVVTKLLNKLWYNYYC